MVTVYRVDPHRRAMVVEPVDLPAFVTAHPGSFAPVPMAGSWQALACVLTNPGVELGVLGSCFRFVLGTFAVDEHTYRACWDVLARDCEFLPVHVNDTRYWVVNVLTVIDALDEERTRFEQIPGGFRGVPLEWAFHQEKLCRPGLFKVPGQNHSVLAVTGFPHAAADFHEQYLRLGISGLRFRKLWEAKC